MERGWAASSMGAATAPRPLTRATRAAENFMFAELVLKNECLEEK
jgi:hypothetical protein